MTDEIQNYNYGFKLGQIAYTEHVTPQEKTIVRFGMIPANLIERAGHDVNDFNGDVTRGFASGVFACAKVDGGMVA